jgi:hypothetical protein
MDILFLINNAIPYFQFGIASKSPRSGGLKIKPNLPLGRDGKPRGLDDSRVALEKDSSIFFIINSRTMKIKPCLIPFFKGREREDSKYFRR